MLRTLGQHKYIYSGFAHALWPATQAPQLSVPTQPCYCATNGQREQSIKCYYRYQTNKMSETHFDEYEHYNFEHDKHIYSGNSGKGRTKKEAGEHTNRNDPSGHSRKIVTKLMNTELNKKTDTKTKN